ncbi:GxxExxY protein [Hymenobacter glacialis]|uniref:GxxExxY protein n=1 Tax=Hymenobacter glacialis TaxID=1908236 RepID=A0A1G1T3S5_9BACT|nr:GxxExxY protein [Hymenobacter glacialis]OGX85529.1 GxxExxY protein [Hymenobacter glacialis]
MSENEISKVVLDAAFRVHSALGPGLLESVYEAALTHELRKQGLEVETQVPVPVVYDGVKLAIGFRLDVLVEGKVILELKSCENLIPIHSKQLLNYLRLADLRLGLLFNFNVESLKGNIIRLANNLR